MKLFPLALGVIFALLLQSCAFLNDTLGSGNGDEGGGGTRGQSNGGTYESYKVLKIPYGHIPPSGQCRVWVPGKPPGKQASSTSCSQAKKDCPANAWIISRTGSDNKLLKVQKCGSIPGKVVSTETYIIDNDAQNDNNNGKGNSNGKGNGNGKK
ncbi:hypothetical protein K6119_19120 [Paracrocinitomix mangrovi]|uniref:hypothetical protein n=1 Tax=Paracrocinitomix mangrovi TaxID=2862509 RepID=UPI001C8DE90B|nr:hypothetical protein [Paracrocinitomix mangrovi]UKN01837.1 hypothetical protein K6119_19120 [Paracrocinitomix mangrovi]